MVLRFLPRHATDWRTNIHRGAEGEPLEVTPVMREMALEAARRGGATYADIRLGETHREYAFARDDRLENFDERDLREVKAGNCDVLMTVDAEAAFDVMAESISHFSR